MILLDILSLFAAINLLTALASFKKRKKLELKTHPDVSIICRTWEDDHLVERFIKGCLAQDYTGKIQIIIADDASTDKTPEICKKYKNKITYIRSRKHHELKAKFLNKIIKTKAKGKIIINMDIDAVMPKNYVTEMVRSLQRCDAVSSACIGGNFGTLVSKVKMLEDYWVYSTGMLGREVLSGESTIYGGSHAIWKKVLEDVGYYGTKTLTEDLEMGIALSENRYRIGFCDNAVVLLEDVETFEQYLRERKRWLEGPIKAAKVYKKWGSFHNTIFGINALLSTTAFISLFGLFFSPLFLIPLLTNVISLALSLKRFRAKPKVYFWIPLYIIFDPLMEFATLALMLLDNIIHNGVRWVTVSGKKYHLGRRLKPSFKR